MAKTLHQIKGEVFEHPMFTIHEDIDWVVDQIAIRYAQEQNKELVGMLEKLHHMCDKIQFPTENELKENAKEIEQLIYKHKVGTQ